MAEAENTVAFLNLTALVRPFNLSGHPALNIPLQTMTDMPVGLQLVGRKMQTSSYVRSRILLLRQRIK